MPRPDDRASLVPTPTRATLFFRTFVPWQFLRFAWINLKMVRMIHIGNHGKVPRMPIALPEDDLQGPHGVDGGRPTSSS